MGKQEYSNKESLYVYVGSLLKYLNEVSIELHIPNQEPVVYLFIGLTLLDCPIDG